MSFLSVAEPRTALTAAAVSEVNGRVHELKGMRSAPPSFKLLALAASAARYPDPGTLSTSPDGCSYQGHGRLRYAIGAGHVRRILTLVFTLHPRRPLVDAQRWAARRRS